MTIFEAIVLALIQGVTEFLPISSSAHLILAPHLFGWQAHDLRFDVVVNAGTLLAAVAYFRADLIALLRRLLGTSCATAEPTSGRPGRGLLTALILGSIPVLVAGLVFYDWISTAARSPEVIAWASIGFGLLLGWTERVAPTHRTFDQLDGRDGLWIGLAQALALIPGTSRSGITMTAGLWRGFDREEAARFSFLLAIPVGVAAFAKDAIELVTEGTSAEGLWPLIIGFVVAAVAAYLVIDWLLAWLRRQSLMPFVVYRILLGVVILIWL